MYSFCIRFLRQPLSRYVDKAFFLRNKTREHSISPFLKHSYQLKQFRGFLQRKKSLDSGSNTTKKGFNFTFVKIKSYFPYFCLILYLLYSDSFVIMRLLSYDIGEDWVIDVRRKLEDWFDSMPSYLVWRGIIVFCLTFWTIVGLLLYFIFKGSR